jgi:hypothetical protein
MTFEFKIKNTVVFSIISESNLIFPHFYSLEAPVWHALIDGNWFFLGNIFIMHFQWNEQVDYTGCLKIASTKKNCGIWKP